MGATHIVMDLEGRGEGARGGSAYRCDREALTREGDLAVQREIRARHPEWAELDLDELADVQGVYWPQIGLASALLVVGAGGLATGLGVIVGNAGTPAIPGCLGPCFGGGGSGSSGTPGNDEGMLIGAGIAGAGGLVLASSIIWLAASGSTRRAAARLRGVNERLLLDADVSTTGATLRVRGTF